MTTNPSEPGLTNSWVRPLILGLSCAILGFVGGWVINKGNGPSVTIPKDNRNFSNAATAPAGRTTTVQEQGSGTDTTAAVPPPDRESIVVAVLNGTSKGGLAATTAGRLRTIGYSRVSTGNVPTAPGQSTTYFRTGQRPAAGRVAEDLSLGQLLTALPATIEAPPAAQVVVVLRAP